MPDNILTAMDRRLVEIEKKIDALSKAIKLDAAGNITISGNSVAIRGNSSLSLTAGATMEISGGALISIKGALIKLNNGSTPIARSTDLVMPTGPFPAPGKIIATGATVLA